MFDPFPLPPLRPPKKRKKEKKKEKNVERVRALEKEVIIQHDTSRKYEREPVHLENNARP